MTERSIEYGVPGSTEPSSAVSRRTGILLILSSCAVTLGLAVFLTTVLLDPFGPSSGIDEKMAIEAETLQDFSTAAGPGD